MFVELHLLQNFAPSCLNRDDTNSPKDCEFGGYRRARISSQCLKRAARTYFKQYAKDLGLDGHLGERTKHLHEWLVGLLVEDGKAEEEASALVRFAIEGNQLKMDDNKTSVLLFLDEEGVVNLKDALLECWSELSKACPTSSGDDSDADKGKKKSAKEKKKDKAAKLPESVGKAFAALQRTTTSAADIALFGRMVAELKDMNVDAACQVAHAISTNKMDLEMDFYTAVDDLQKKSEESGAGMMGIVEFNSSCFYRYALIDVEQLAANLNGDRALAASAALAFARASVFAIPTGKQNSMAAQNLPAYVRAIVKDGGAPRSFANAFLRPVLSDTRGETDLAEISVKRLEEHDGKLTRMYGAGGVKADLCASLYDETSESVDSLLERLGAALAGEA